MFRRFFLVITLVLLLAVTSVVAFEKFENDSRMASGKTWYVGPPPSDFSNIQEAVSNESVLSGDTIEVKWQSSPYNESVFVNKTLTIRHYSSDPPGFYPTIETRGTSGFQVVAPGVEIDGFILQNCSVGIDLASFDNVILNNTIMTDVLGRNGIVVRLTSGNNTFIQNKLVGSGLGFGLDYDYEVPWNESAIGHFINYVDESNTVNGKPIYYWIDKHNKQIPQDAGYVAIINSTGIIAENVSFESNYQAMVVADSMNVTVQNPSFKMSRQGILVVNSSQASVRDVRCQSPQNSLQSLITFADVENSSVRNVNVLGLNLPDGVVFVRANYSSVEDIVFSDTVMQDGIIFEQVQNSLVQNISFLGVNEIGTGILLNSSQNNIIQGCTLVSHVGFLPGIHLWDSNSNLVAWNSVTNEADTVQGSGMLLWNSYYNTLAANSIVRTTVGLSFEYSNDTTIYHNNFLGNQQQVFNYSSSNNSFNNGYEGNYWSGYVGPDVDGDGIGDVPYTTPQASDSRPLMVDWSANRTYERPMEKRPSDPRWIQKLYAFSNSTLGSPPVGFVFNRTIPQITLKVTCGYTGFLNITVPRNWIDGPFSVAIDEVQSGYLFSSNSTHSSFYLTFAVGKHVVKIGGTELGGIAGDLNGDGIVDIYDAIILSANFGTQE